MYNAHTLLQKTVSHDSYIRVLYPQKDVQQYSFYYMIIGLGLWCLTPLSTLLQLYRGGQFY
jgi:hypothetical protein